MGKHNKIKWTYEVIEADPLTEEELQQIAHILAKMIFEYHYGIRKEEQKSLTNKEDK